MIYNVEFSFCTINMIMQYSVACKREERGMVKCDVSWQRKDEGDQKYCKNVWYNLWIAPHKI